MQTVELNRTLPAPLEDVAALLTPETVVEFEGQYRIKDIEKRDGRTIVTGWPHGRPFEPRYVFAATDEGFAYRLLGSGPRPLVTSETTATLVPRDDTTELRLRSQCRRAAPIPLLERYAAWRRRAALERLCERAAAVLREE